MIDNVKINYDHYLDYYNDFIKNNERKFTGSSNHMVRTIVDIVSVINCNQL